MGVSMWPVWSRSMPCDREELARLKAELEQQRQRANAAEELAAALSRRLDDKDAEVSALRGFLEIIHSLSEIPLASELSEGDEAATEESER